MIRKKVGAAGKKGKTRTRKPQSRKMYRLLALILLASFFSSAFFSFAKADPVIYPIYAIYGYATCCDDTPAYQGATVTVINQDTGVVKYDTTENDGYFGVTYTNIMASEWSHGDTLIVWVNGTGIYMEWTGKQVTMFDENIAPPHRINITLCSPGTRIPDPPENLQASLGITNGLYWIVLKWDPPSSMEGDSTVTYHIYRGANPQEKIYQGSTSDSLTFNDTSVFSNTTYYYGVTTKNTAGESILSSMVNKTTRISPTAHFSYLPQDPHLNESIVFLDSSSDQDGIITNWTWNITPGGTLYGKQISYVFSQPGTYTVTLMVTDNTGDQDTATRSLSLSSPMTKHLDLNYLFSWCHSLG